MSVSAVFGEAVFGEAVFGISNRKLTTYATLAEFKAAVEQIPDTNFVTGLMYREDRSRRRKLILVRWRENGMG